MANTTNSFPLSGAINLHARLGHGQLTITAVDDLEAEATVTLRPHAASKLPKTGNDR